MEKAIDEDGKTADSVITINDTSDVNQEVTPLVLRGWLRRAKRKFREGVIVLKITSQGKLVKRTVFLNAKPEYFEITSAKLFDIGYHLTDVDDVTIGCQSVEFDAFMEHNPERFPNAEKSCVIQVESRTISLVFKSQSDLRDFVYLMRVEIKYLHSKYTSAKTAVTSKDV